MQPKVNQKTVILNHLRQFGSIEPLEALKEYGVYRLGARIGDLRAAGHNIKTETITRVSRITGRPRNFARYILQE